MNFLLKSQAFIPSSIRMSGLNEILRKIIFQIYINWPIIASNFSKSGFNITDDYFRKKRSVFNYI